MYLYFGVLAKLLNYCRQNTTQSTLIARIARCLDQNSNYIVPEDRFKDGWEIKGDDPAANKLLRCKKNFIFSDGNIINNIAEASVIEHFKAGVAPLIDEDQKPIIVLALLDIIRKDNDIDDKNQSNFEKFFGDTKEQLLQKAEFSFPDLLSRALLYTTCGNTPNTNGQGIITSINDTYLEQIRNCYQHEYQWDLKTQTLTLLFQVMYEKFQELLEKYAIPDFIGKVDPTNYMHLDWPDNLKDFSENVDNEILIKFSPFPFVSLGFTHQKIQEFAETLNSYNDYLSTHMIPLIADGDGKGKPGTMVSFIPLYREENVKWEVTFEEKTNEYRKKLCKIREDICHHMLWFPDTPPKDSNQIKGDLQ